MFLHREQDPASYQYFFFLAYLTDFPSKLVCQFLIHRPASYSQGLENCVSLMSRMQSPTRLTDAASEDGSYSSQMYVSSALLSAIPTARRTENQEPMLYI